MIQSLIFGIIFLKILLRAHDFFIFVHAFQWTSSEFFFFDFRFFSRKSQSQQKLAKKITHFTIQFCLKKLTHFINLNSLDIENNMLPQHIQKPFQQIFQQTYSAWRQKKHLHCTISWRPRTAFYKHFESKCSCISKYLRRKIFVPKM